MTVLSVLFAAAILSGIFFFIPYYIFGRQILFTHIILASVFLCLWRMVFSKVVVGKPGRRRLAVIGTGEIVSSFTEEISRLGDTGFLVKNVCILGDDGEPTCKDIQDAAVSKTFDDLLINNTFDALAIDTSHRLFTDSEVRRLLALRLSGKALYDLPSLYKNITGQVPLSLINGKWLLFNYSLRTDSGRTYLKIKRATDLFLAFVMLVLSAPFMLVAALCILVFDGKPVLYKQERLGLDRKPFVCLKFRTMRTDAEKRKGPVWAAKNDSRITFLGKFLRKSRLDELPQLFNILGGDLSFIGPRPIRAYFADQYAATVPFYNIRYSVKPGLTGWAQVHGAYAVPNAREALQYELFYIQNMSLVLDLQIVFSTIKTMLRIRGR